MEMDQVEDVTQKDEVYLDTEVNLNNGTNRGIPPDNTQVYLDNNIYPISSGVTQTNGVTQIKGVTQKAVTQTKGVTQIKGVTQKAVTQTNGRLHIRIGLQLEDEIRKQSDELGLSISVLVRDILTHYFIK